MQGFPSHLPCLKTWSSGKNLGSSTIWTEHKWRFNQQELYCTNSAIKKHKSTPRDLANKSLGFHQKKRNWSNTNSYKNMYFRIASHSHSLTGIPTFRTFLSKFTTFIHHWTCIREKYNISLTWIKANIGMISLYFHHDSRARSRREVIIIYLPLRSGHRWQSPTTSMAPAIGAKQQYLQTENN